MLVLPKWRALIALVGGALMLCIGAIPLGNVMQYLDFNVLLMLFGTMGLVYYFIESKMPAFLAERIAQKTKTVRATVVALSAFAGIISAFIDNIPYVTAMIPVVATITLGLGVQTNILFYALLVGATLGGNLTPIGASANVAALGILRKEGHTVKNGEFMKVSVPFTLTAVLSGYVMLFLFWGL